MYQTKGHVVLCSMTEDEKLTKALSATPKQLNYLLCENRISALSVQKVLDKKYEEAHNAYDSLVGAVGAAFLDCGHYVCVCTVAVSAAFNNLIENCGANDDNVEDTTGAETSATPSGGAPENDDSSAGAAAGEAGGAQAGTFVFIVLCLVHIEDLQTNGIATNGILNTVNADDVHVLLDIERRHQIATERFEKARQIAEELAHAAEYQGMLFVGHASFLASWLVALETVASKELPIIERYEAEKALKRRRGPRNEGVVAVARNVVAKAGPGYVEVRWQPAPAASWPRIMRYRITCEPGQRIQQVGRFTTECRFELANDKYYQFVVEALPGGKISEKSNPAMPMEKPDTESIRKATEIVEGLQNQSATVVEEVLQLTVQAAEKRSQLDKLRHEAADKALDWIQGAKAGRVKSVDAALRAFNGGADACNSKTKDPLGMGALHFAAAEGHIEVIKFIVEKCNDRAAAVNDSDDHGMTPLHHAAANGWKEIAEFLLEKGARAGHKNFVDQTPSVLAAINGHLELAALLGYNCSKDKEGDIVVSELRSMPWFSKTFYGMYGDPYLQDTDLEGGHIVPVMKDTVHIIKTMIKDVKEGTGAMPLFPTTGKLERLCSILETACAIDALDWSDSKVCSRFCFGYPNDDGLDTIPSLATMAVGDLISIPGGWSNPDGGHAINYTVERFPDRNGKKKWVFVFELSRTFALY